MATVLRSLSYRYQWLYDFIARTAALGVGGQRQFRHLPLQHLTITPEMTVLDLCCGSGQTTQVLCQYSNHVTGLDASPRAIRRARSHVPQATFVEAWAEAMPFRDTHFDLVHTSVALHEMTPSQRRAILQEIYRVLKPGGILALVDFHAPGNPLVWPGLALFLWLFETATAWQLIQTDLVAELQQQGFQRRHFQLHAAGSLQVIQVSKPAIAPQMTVDHSEESS